MKDMNSRAFLSGFLDSFGGVGAVLKTRIQGDEVLRESKQPVRRSDRLKVRVSSIGFGTGACSFTKVK